MLKPVKKENLPKQIFDQLCRSILEGVYQPGDHLPPERELCNTLQVNRGALREALKRLEQSRLIQIRQGEGSIVLNFSETAGLELLPYLITPGQELDFVTMRSIVELRLLIASEAGRLAAIRIKPAQLNQINKIVADIENCPDDLDLFQQYDWDFHYTLALGSENIAIILMLNTIRDIYFEFKDFFASMLQPIMEARSLYRQIYTAVQTQESERAQILTSELIKIGNYNFLKIYAPDNN